MDTVELNDEQLDTVTGGSQSNSNATANLSDLTNVTPVIGSGIGFSNVGNASVAQLSSTEQVNKYKSEGFFF